MTAKASIQRTTEKTVTATAKTSDIQQTTKKKLTSSAKGSSLPKFICRSSSKSSHTPLTIKRKATTTSESASALSACSSTSKSSDVQTKTGATSNFSPMASCSLTSKSIDVPLKTKSNAATTCRNSLPNSHSSGTQPNKQFDLGASFFGRGQYKIPKKKQQETSHLKAKTKSSLVERPDSTKKVNAQKDPLPQQHKSEVIYQQLNDPNYKLYALFLKTSMPFFDNPNQVGAHCIICFIDTASFVLNFIFQIYI